MQMVQNTVVLSVGEQSWMIQVWNFDSVPSVMEITSIVRIIYFTHQHVEIRIKDKLEGEL